MTAWVRELAEERRKASKDDLISDLVSTHDMGDQMTDDEIVMMVVGLILAGRRDHGSRQHDRHHYVA